MVRYFQFIFILFYDFFLLFCQYVLLPWCIVVVNYFKTYRYGIGHLKCLVVKFKWTIQYTRLFTSWHMWSVVHVPNTTCEVNQSFESQTWPFFLFSKLNIFIGNCTQCYPRIGEVIFWHMDFSLLSKFKMVSSL